MAKDKITRAQIQEIRTLTRRANRRIERAGKGQRKVLEYYARRKKGKPGKFSAATKGMSSQQAQAQIEKLKRFLGAPSTTIRGWERIKRETVRKANVTLKTMEYNLTDEELADILEQLADSDDKDYYRAVNLVEAAKIEAGNAWEATEERILDIIMEKASAQEALQKALNARKKRDSAAAEEAKKHSVVEKKKERLKVSLGVQKGKNPRKKR